MMKRRIALLVCMLLLVVAVAQAQSTAPQSMYKNWKLYTANGEKFSAALPNYPSMHTMIEKRQNPEKDRRVRLLRASNNGVAYTIYVVENPEPRQSLDVFIKEQTSNPTLDLTNAKDLTLDGIAGKSFTYPDGKGMVQFFSTGDRLYDFRAHGAYLDDARITTFFYFLSLKSRMRLLRSLMVQGRFTKPILWTFTDHLTSIAKFGSTPNPSPITLRPFSSGSVEK